MQMQSHQNLRGHPKSKVSLENRLLIELETFVIQK